MTILQGVITKCGVMDKTVTVTVARKTVHPVLLKAITHHKKYLVHDEFNQGKLNQSVSIHLSRPVSKRKSFHLLEIHSKPTFSSTPRPASSVLAQLPGDLFTESLPISAAEQAEKELEERRTAEEGRKERESERVRKALEGLGIESGV